MKTLRKTVSDGVKTLYDVDFELGYLEKAHVYVYSGTDNALYETQLTYIWQNATQIELTVPAEYVVGTVINIRRVAPRDKLYVEFKNSTGITQLNLNSANLQALMLIEEQDDGFAAEGYYEKQDLNLDDTYRVKNMIDGEAPQDAVTLKQVFSLDEGYFAPVVIETTAQADRSETEADRAQTIADSVLGGGLDWSPLTQTSGFVAQNTLGYCIDTTSGGVTATLPLNPEDGDTVGFLDIANNFEAVNCVVARNGALIMGVDEDLDLDHDRQFVLLIYKAASNDWRIIGVTPYTEVEITTNYRKNLIMNGKFNVYNRVEDLILAAGQYGPDRWKGGAAGCTYSITAGVCTITAGSLIQVVEDGNVPGGDAILSNQGTALGTIDGGVTTTTLIRDTQTQVEFGIGTIDMVQLEIGDKATPFEDRSYGEELALCKRYFRTGTSGFSGYTNAPTLALRNIIADLGEGMRVAPSVSLTGTHLNMSTWADNIVASPNQLITTASTDAIGMFRVYSIVWTADAEL